MRTDILCIPLNLDADSEKILCYDLFSKRYFTTTMAAVINAQYHIKPESLSTWDIRI